MEVNDYVIQYPIDAVHTVKFAELLGKPETAVVKMVKENKLPVIELRDPSKPNARVGEKWVFIPEFNRAVREAFYMHGTRHARLSGAKDPLHVTRCVRCKVFYEEEVERVVGIYAPHLGARHIHITRTTDWRIVPKVPVVEPLTLKSGIAAPRSPVNNCGKLTGGDTSLLAPTPSEHAAAVLNLVDDGVIEWNDPEVVRALRGALKYGLRRPNRQQRNGSPLKPHEIAPSARLTRSERLQITRIRQLENALARCASQVKMIKHCQDENDAQTRQPAQGAD